MIDSIGLLMVLFLSFFFILILGIGIGTLYRLTSANNDIVNYYKEPEADEVETSEGDGLITLDYDDILFPTE